MAQIQVHDNPVLTLRGVTPGETRAAALTIARLAGAAHGCVGAACQDPNHVGDMGAGSRVLQVLGLTPDPLSGGFGTTPLGLRRKPKRPTQPG